MKLLLVTTLFVFVSCAVVKQSSEVAKSDEIKDEKEKKSKKKRAPTSWVPGAERR